MTGELEGLRIAILVEEGFEQEELTRPQQALEEAGATTEVISPQKDRVRGWDHTRWGDEIDVDTPLDRASPEDYDALLLPGGVMNPDKLRMDEKAVRFVRSFFDANKPVAVICHGPWTLIEAGVVRNRQITSYPSLRTDLENAGAVWVDQEVVVDENLVSSRRPDDIPAFNERMIEVFSRLGRYRQMMEEQRRQTARGMS
ncbi:MAG: type 1 glutamine amidotransferase domain-containing protein [Anaerolineae bacterium]|jgi:protease I